MKAGSVNRMMSMGRYLGRYLVNTEEYNGMRKRSERCKCQLNNVNGKGYLWNIVEKSEKKLEVEGGVST